MPDGERTDDHKKWPFPKLQKKGQAEPQQQKTLKTAHETQTKRKKTQCTIGGTELRSKERKLSFWEKSILEPCNSKTFYCFELLSTLPALKEVRAHEPQRSSQRGITQKTPRGGSASHSFSRIQPIPAMVKIQMPGFVISIKLR